MKVLLSVTDKAGVAEFARGLADLGAELISTGGTARLLRETGIPVRDVSDVTGFPEMLDGRVKTMHPKITGAILAIRDNPEHAAALREHSIEPIDMVVVNLYQFEKIASKIRRHAGGTDRKHRYWRPHNDSFGRQKLAGRCHRYFFARLPGDPRRTSRRGNALARNEMAARATGFPDHGRLRPGDQRKAFPRERRARSAAFHS